MEIQQLLTEILTKQSDALAKLARPYVIADVYPRRSVNMLNFRIRNVGYTPAFNIQAKIEPPIPFRERLSSEMSIFSRTISVLGPKEEISFFFDSAIELFRRENPVLQFDVGIHYADADGATYQQVTHIDIDLFKHLAIELPATDKIADELGKIHRELEKISRYVDDVRRQEMLREFHETQKKDEAERPGDEETSTDK